MSHSRERKEKICLNCGASLYGRYCHQCGQENIEPKESFGHLVTHFFNDITHFDGKFFVTLKDLITKPGFLSREYMLGRRSSYLHPIRMYVFTSALFFIIFFSVINPRKFQFNFRPSSKDTVLTLNNGLTAALSKVKTKEDSASVEEAFSKLKKIPYVAADTAKKSKSGGLHTNWNVIPEFSYASREQYDSAQQRLSPENRDSWFRTIVKHKVIDLDLHYRQDKEAFFKDWMAAFVHTAPQLLFVSLPLFALLLKLLYIRRRQFYYVDHGIFTIHLYIYSFIAMLVFFGLNGLQHTIGSALYGILQGVLWIWSLYYFYKAMRNFYKQGRFKTLVKFMLLNLLSFTMILTLFVIFFLFSVLEI